MKLTLTKGLDNEQASDLKQQFIQCKRLRDRYVEVLNEKIEALYTAMRDESNYEKPAWSERQADRLGEIRAYKTAISLLSEKK